MGRPVFKTGGGRQTSLVGSIPTLFRQSLWSREGRNSGTGLTKTTEEQEQTDDNDGSIYDPDDD